ncbi:MAG: hypothetical protein J1E98_00290 [Lachnospiraceae bacterium]|nr:hypothetical protein [Lachnospiraceae bacterium]
MAEIAIFLNEEFNRQHSYDCANVVITDNNGKKKSKIVEIGSLLKAFKCAVKMEADSAPIGKIPFGYYDGAISMCSGKLCADIVTVLPASMQLMKYENTQYDVCVPSLVFSFHVNKGRLERTQVFTLKDEEATEDSILYRYPYGNVHDNGNVCWGNNAFPVIPEIKRLETAMTLFIQSPCNSDLYESKKCIGQTNVPLRELFEQLRNVQSFPEEYLMPIKKQRGNMRLKDLITWKK